MMSRPVTNLDYDPAMWATAAILAIPILLATVTYYVGTWIRR